MELLDVKSLITDAKSKNATDIHICCGYPVLYRIGKQLIPANGQPVTPEISRSLSVDLLKDEDTIRQFDKQLDYDKVIEDENGRFRVTLSYNGGHVGIVIRILPLVPKSIDELHLNPKLKDMSQLSKGLLLITGSPSQGKTTTVSAIINEINCTRNKHIVWCF